MLVPVGLLEVLGGLLEVLDCWHGCWRWWQGYWRCWQGCWRWWQGCRRVVLGLLGVVRVAVVVFVQFSESSSCPFLQFINARCLRVIPKTVVSRSSGRSTNRYEHER